MSFEFLKTLCELLVTLSFYVVLAGCGVSGIAIAVAIMCWVIDYIRRELGR